MTNGDEAPIAFLQRMAGYILPGVTHEHALFFAYGTGANGKSTFLNALAACLGDYHATARRNVSYIDRQRRWPSAQYR